MEKDMDLGGIDIMGPAPAFEPDRQYYFMAKCRQLLREKSLEKGRTLTCLVQTLGCQMNAKDSEKMTAVLEQIGYRETEDKVADLVLFNTCTVRENANLKIYGRLGYLKNQKKSNPDMKIVLCGCMMQEKELSLCGRGVRHPQYLQARGAFIHAACVRTAGDGRVGRGKGDCGGAAGQAQVSL